MEVLLKEKYTSHYAQPVATITDFSLQTDNSYFEIEDRDNIIFLHTAQGAGMAKYRNNSNFNVNIVNYDAFLTSLDHTFQQGRKRCDLIVYTLNNYRYFLLNELKDRKKNTRVRNIASLQLFDTLQTLLAVPEIKAFSDQFAVKRCCYFNKQPTPPSTITAIIAFGRINTLIADGLHMPHSGIESMHFEFWDYSGSTVFPLVP